MENKIILVTGSSKGLGFEIAKKLSYEGFCIILNSRNKKNLENAIKKLNHKIEHFIFHYDFTKKDSVYALNDFLTTKNIYLAGIVHNLGGKIPNDKHPIDLKVLRNTFRLNLEVAIEINNLIIPQMIKREGGKIVHISSLASIDGNASPCYSLSKGALNIYTKNLARYYAKYNISICCVLPPILEHEGSEWEKKRKLEPKKYFKRLSDFPLKRFANPTEISEFISMLFKLNTIQITGSIFDLRGGL